MDLTNIRVNDKKRGKIFDTKKGPHASLLGYI